MQIGSPAVQWAHPLAALKGYNVPIQGFAQESHSAVVYRHEPVGKWLKSRLLPINHILGIEARDPLDDVLHSKFQNPFPMATDKGFPSF